MSMLPSIHARLHQLQERHEEIALLLAEQEIMADQNRFRDLSVEYSQLEPVVAAWAKWQQAGQSIEEAQSLLNSRDKEMQELAAEELAAATDEQQTLEDQLNILLLPKDPDDDNNIFIEIMPKGTDKESMETIVEEIRERVGELEGVKNINVKIVNWD